MTRRRQAPGSSRPRGARLAAITGVLVLAGACGSPAPTTSHSTGCPSTANEIRYGCPPTDGGPITYQPDVVMIPGGAEAIRSWDPDGVRWTIKGDAKGVQQLARGKVMFVTGLAVGRVLDVHNDGPDRVVTLGPAAIGELIKDGEINSQGPVDLEAPEILQAPGMSPIVIDTTGGGISSRGPDVGPVLAGGADLAMPDFRLASFVQPVPRPAHAPDVDVDGIDVDLGSGSVAKALCCTTKLGATFHYDAGGLRIQGGMYYTLAKPTVSYFLQFKNGQLEDGFLDIYGLTGLHLDFKTASDSGLDGNITKLIYIPVEWKFRKVYHLVEPDEAGIPLPFITPGVTQFLMLATRFQAKKSVFNGSADYTFNAQGLRVQWSKGQFVADLMRAPGFAAKTHVYPELLREVPGAQALASVQFHQDGAQPAGKGFVLHVCRKS